MHAPYFQPRLLSFTPHRLPVMLLALLNILAALLLPTLHLPTPANSPSMPLIGQQFGKLPLSFVPNVGQNDPHVHFQVSSLGGTLFFTSAAVVLVLPGVPAPDTVDLAPMSPNTLRFDQKDHVADIPIVPTTVLKLRFIGANSAPVITGGELSPGIVNHFLGKDPAHWRVNMPTYSEVVYQALYPGIDLHYDGTEGQVKGTYVVAAGADPTQIQWRYDGAQQILVDAASGDLVIILPGGHTLRERAPVAWQMIDGQRMSVGVSYRLDDHGGVRFALGHYDPRALLTLDPTLVYNTFLGGGLNDLGAAIAVDGLGNMYVTGSTLSCDFPATNAIQSTCDGRQEDVFITKLNPSGNALVYSTYLGGDADDSGVSIVVDDMGNSYVAGSTKSANFPNINAFQGDSNDNDAFVVKLNADGNKLLYSTYLGGNGYDKAYDIEIDEFNNVYVVGATQSADFPMFDAHQAFIGGMFDAFIAKLDASGNSLLYSTYLGGRYTDYASGITVDNTGSIYVTGDTVSDNFPVINALQSASGDDTERRTSDAFIAKLNAGGNTLLYSTYLGGDDYDSAVDIVVDGFGNAYVAGATRSTNFPTANALQDTFAGGTDYRASDAFIAKLDANGSTLLYSTYLGGEGNDGAVDIAVDEVGNAYLTGETASTNFPTSNPLQAVNGGYKDAFVAKLNASGSELLYSTYIGGNNDDFSAGMAIDGFGNIYIVGNIGEKQLPFPTVNPFQATNAGFMDAYILRISVGDEETPTPPQLDRTPLIFIHGIMGGRLREVGGDELWPRERGDESEQRLSLKFGEIIDIKATDAIRSIDIPGSFDVDFYKPLIEMLIDPKQGGYREYNVANDPARRTVNGCDLSQQDRKPTLFVFAYDWRKSNAENATLLGEYIGCVRRFYEGTKVDILTHSMGGLLARNYLLQDSSKVRKLITIAAPWLGAPSAIQALETGARFGYKEQLFTGISNDELKKLVEYFPSVHELLPSNAYSVLIGSTFREVGWDINGNGSSIDVYSYTRLQQLLNNRHPQSIPPGTASSLFHGTNGVQDDWRNDQSGVQFYHIVGVQPKAATVGEIEAVLQTSCSGIIRQKCTSVGMFKPIYREGDGTVPTQSATRIGASSNFNAPGVAPQVITGKLTEHTELTKNPEVYAYILSYLGITTKLDSNTIAQQHDVKSPKEPKFPSAEIARYIELVGGATLTVTNSLGQTLSTITTTQNYPTDVIYNPMSTIAHSLAVDSAQAYTLTLVVDSVPFYAEVRTGTDISTIQATRFLDVDIPMSSIAQLVITPSGSTLKYDADNDGSFETSVSPTVDLSGMAATDTEAPIIAVTTTGPLTNMAITIMTRDTASGVKRVLYSLDGVNFQPYTTSITIDAFATPHLSVIADDNAANRATLFDHALLHHAYLPLIVR